MIEDYCEYRKDCVSKVTENCIPNYTDCMVYKFSKLKEQGNLENVGKDTKNENI